MDYKLVHVVSLFLSLKIFIIINKLFNALLFSIFRLEVMPGFVTSILRYETQTLLCADISHKILRSDTVLDIMYEMYNRSAGDAFYENCIRKFVGSIVLTR